MAGIQKPASPEPRISEARAAAALDALRGQSMAQLSGLLKGMFDRIDTLLYDWARDLPDSEQQRYMDVMVVVRGKRAEMEGAFAANLMDGFARVAKPRAERAEGGGIQSFDFDGLSLVDTDEMDISVAIDSMVAKARLDLAAEVGLLRRRFAHAFPKAKLDGAAMPLDPGAIADAFKPAVRLADALGVAEKLLILKVFQQLVMRELKGVLDAANQTLVDAGVLPDLKLAFAQDKQAAKKKAATPESPAKPAAPDTEDIFAILQQMMMMGRGPGNTAPGQAAAGVSL
ncbi:MAG: DUF1631 family protein, partial [Moraxellaceae bacterium]